MLEKPSHTFASHSASFHCTEVRILEGLANPQALRPLAKLKWFTSKSNEKICESQASRDISSSFHPEAIN
jgi:hypothetical protein